MDELNQLFMMSACGQVLGWGRVKVHLMLDALGFFRLMLYVEAIGPDLANETFLKRATVLIRWFWLQI